MAGSVAAKAWSVIRDKWYGLQLDDDDNLKVAQGGLTEALDKVSIHGSRLAPVLLETAHTIVTGATEDHILPAIGNNNAIYIDLLVSSITGTVNFHPLGSCESANPASFGAIYNMDTNGAATLGTKLDASSLTATHYLFKILGLPPFLNLQMVASASGGATAVYTLRYCLFNI